MKKCSYCGMVSDDTLKTCSECGTSLPNERFVPKPSNPLTPSELQAQNKRLRDGVICIVLSLGVLAIGCTFFMGREPINDFRPMKARGVAFLFTLIVSLVFAILSVRSFYHGCCPKSSAG